VGRKPRLRRPGALRASAAFRSKRQFAYERARHKSTMGQGPSKGGLCGCFSPRVAETNHEETVKKPAPASIQEKEDSANGDGPARLTVGVPQRTQSDELEDFDSPTSSYATAFSEQDPHDIADSLR